MLEQIIYPLHYHLDSVTFTRTSCWFANQYYQLVNFIARCIVECKKLQWASSVALAWAILHRTDASLVGNDSIIGYPRHHRLCGTSHVDIGDAQWPMFVSNTLGIISTQVYVELGTDYIQLSNDVCTTRTGTFFLVGWVDSQRATALYTNCLPSIALKILFCSHSGHPILHTTHIFNLSWHRSLNNPIWTIMNLAT